MKQKVAFEKTGENGGNVSEAMRDAKYSEATVHTPQNLTESKGWNELLKEHLPDKDLTEKHKELLHSTRIDHMVFPVGPELEEENLEGSLISDQEITQMLSEVNCKVRKIVHGETARHVYFWSSDNKARKDGLDMAYKLKGSYAPEKSISIAVHTDPQQMVLLTQMAKESGDRIKKAHGDKPTDNPETS